MTSEPDYGQLRPRLGWLPIDAIKKTFECTTQLTRMPMSTILKKWYKSLNQEHITREFPSTLTSYIPDIDF
jgi:hypothetical protein